MGFDRVKQILEDSLGAWSAAHNNDAPDLSGHGGSFGWSTKQQLLAASGHGRPLIQPELIGTPNAANANLLIDLRVGFNNRRMPLGGPYVPDDQIDEIQQWIADGCPD